MLRYREIVFLVVVMDCVSSVAGQCTKTGPCSCDSPQGSIDLSPIASSDGSPAFMDMEDTQSAYRYSYNPCHPFTEGSCTDVASCQITLDKTQQFPAGSQDSADFQQDSGTGDIKIVYSSTDSFGTTRKTEVTLKCDPGPDTLSVSGETGENSATYAMTLSSPHCCRGSAPDVTVTVELSVGTVLCIIFLVTVVLYVAVGVGIQKGIRKAQGKEVIPNYGFWSVIPGYVKPLRGPDSATLLLGYRNKGTAVRVSAFNRPYVQWGVGVVMLSGVTVDFHGHVSVTGGQSVQHIASAHTQ
ncbi:hypothetical protein BaRGS_00019512, partial [Batillaria attramentaria]